jgi:hypothetical protein
MSKPMSNVQTLVDAGLARADHLTEQDRKVIDSLTEQEIKTLLQIKVKLGDTMMNQKVQQFKFI